VCAALVCELSAENAMSQVTGVASGPKLASLTRENVAAADDYYDHGLPTTSRSQWSVDSCRRDEVNPYPVSAADLHLIAVFH